MSLTLAIPRGRIAAELAPLLQLVGIEPEPSFYDGGSRKLRFATNLAGLAIVRVRSFDVVAIVALGGAEFGVVGSDARLEFGIAPILPALNLEIGLCRLSVAAEIGAAKQLSPGSRITVATKYPKTTKAHFAARGIHARCLKLHGALELAPHLGLSEYVVDLVSTGATLAENGLREIETICEVSSELIVNTRAARTQSNTLWPWIERFQAAVMARGTGCVPPAPGRLQIADGRSLVFNPAHLGSVAAPVGGGRYANVAARRLSQSNRLQSDRVTSDV